MLEKIRIENFKSWKDTGEIQLAPLTVFFGSNSSGKSSLNQFLLMLKQTAQSPDRQRVFHFGDKKTPIDLGTYKDIVFGHDEKLDIRFAFQWNLRKQLVVEDYSSTDRKKYSGSSIHFSAEVGLSSGKPQQGLVVKTMSYTLGDPNDTGLQVLMKQKGNENGKKGDYELEAENYELDRGKKGGRRWPLRSPTRFYGFPDEAVAYYQNADFVRDLALMMEQLFNNIYYLGPLRDFPQRSYTWSGETPEHVGWRGERMVDAMLAAKERLINFGKQQRYRKFQEAIAFWLENMGLIESFKVRLITEEKRDYEVLVKTPGVAKEVNITDVGFGVSQVLPVIVECFYCKPDSILIIEQPEIHLHPMVQAALADLFIAAVSSKEEYEDRNIQLIIESHSEHFLRRLQRRIAEEVIPAEKTAIYFCRPNNTGSSLLKLDVDLFGNIMNWPEDFFGDEIGDLAEMTKAEMRRRRKEKSDH